MKQNKGKILRLSLCLLIMSMTSVLSAQTLGDCGGDISEGNPCPCNPSCLDVQGTPSGPGLVPIDGGVIALFAAALFYGVKKNIKKK